MEQVDRLSHRVEDILRQVPEVEDVVRRAERAEDPMPHTLSDVLVSLEGGRESGTRRIAIEASVTGRDLSSTGAAIRERLAAELVLPSRYFFDLAGRVESQARASRALTVAVSAALFGVFILLTVALGSAVEAALILVTIPIAFVGGILALLVAGETWTVSSLVGLIGLFGIAVQNNLVLVTQARGLEREILAVEREASIGRVRPKLMTAGTAMLGLLPLLLLLLHGTEIERPLATVMIGGLFTSTIFTLMVLPVSYLLVHRWLRERSRCGDERDLPGEPA